MTLDRLDMKVKVVEGQGRRLHCLIKDKVKGRGQGHGSRSKVKVKFLGLALLSAAKSNNCHYQSKVIVCLFVGIGG